MTIKELPQTERPYEKLELYGEKSLSNAELLAIIIKTGTKQESSVDIARKILKLNDSYEQESLNFLRDLSIEEITKIKGMGKIKALQLKAVCELATRMNLPQNYRKIKVKEPNDIVKILMNEMQYEKIEIAKVVLLDSKLNILKIKNIAIGGNNFVSIGMKEILSEAVKINAPKIILVHNHPSRKFNTKSKRLWSYKKTRWCIKNAWNRTNRSHSNWKFRVYKYKNYRRMENKIRKGLRKNEIFYIWFKRYRNRFRNSK